MILPQVQVQVPMGESHLRRLTRRSVLNSDTISFVRIHLLVSLPSQPRFVQQTPRVSPSPPAESGVGDNYKYI